MRTGGDQFRIPASELEQAVLDAVLQWLKDEKRVLCNTGSYNPAQALAFANETIRQLQDHSTQHETLRDLIRRITVYPEQLDIELAGDAQVGQHRIKVPILIKRLGLAVRLIVGKENTQPRIDKKLLALISKALRWFELLESGKCDSLAAIGLREGVNSSYVSRIINLAFLSPDIVQVLAQGRQPEHITAERLSRMGRPPVSWEDQWQWLGCGQTAEHRMHTSQRCFGTFCCWGAWQPQSDGKTRP
jgi:site-specific DNA recombinase